jgi:hypothetical protein
MGMHDDVTGVEPSGVLEKRLMDGFTKTAQGDKSDQGKHDAQHEYHGLLFRASELPFDKRLV